MENDTLVLGVFWSNFENLREHLLAIEGFIILKLFQSIFGLLKLSVSGKMVRVIFSGKSLYSFSFKFYLVLWFESGFLSSSIPVPSLIERQMSLSNSNAEKRFEQMNSLVFQKKLQLSNFKEKNRCSSSSLNF